MTLLFTYIIKYGSKKRKEREESLKIIYLRKGNGEKRILNALIIGDRDKSGVDQTKSPKEFVFTIFNDAQEIARNHVVGVFVQKEKVIIHLRFYGKSRHKILECLRKNYSVSEFDERFPLMGCVWNAPYLKWKPGEKYSLGYIKAMEYVMHKAGQMFIL